MSESGPDSDIEGLADQAAEVGATTSKSTLKAKGRHRFVSFAVTSLTRGTCAKSSDRRQSRPRCKVATDTSSTAAATATAN